MELNVAICIYLDPSNNTKLPNWIHPFQNQAIFNTKLECNILQFHESMEWEEKLCSCYGERLSDLIKMKGRVMEDRRVIGE